MDTISYVLGLKKGMATANTQEKTVEITENGTMEVLPDAGYALAKVIANVNVASSGSEVKFVAKSVTIPSGIGRVSVNFGFAPDFLLLVPQDGVSTASYAYMSFWGTSTRFAELFNYYDTQYSAYIEDSGKIKAQNCGAGIDKVITGLTAQLIHTADATGFTLGNKLAAGSWRVLAFGF